MKTLQRIFSFLLVVLILVSTTGITVEKFYCGSCLKSIHVFTSPKPCCPQPNTPAGSCHTENEYNKADIIAELPPLTLKLVLPASSYAHFQVYLSPFHAVDLPFIVKYLNYKPPLIPQDIPVLIQSFLI